MSRTSEPTWLVLSACIRTQTDLLPVLVLTRCFLTLLLNRMEENVDQNRVVSSEL